MKEEICPFCGAKNDIEEEIGVCQNCEQAVLFTAKEDDEKESLLSLAEKDFADAGIPNAWF